MPKSPSRPVPRKQQVRKARPARESAGPAAGRRWAARARWAIALGVAVLGLTTCAPSSAAGAVGLALYLLPLALQLTPWAAVRAYAVWLGIFLGAQTAYSYWAVPTDYKTHPPYMKDRITVTGDGLHGISGLQTVTADERGFRVNRPVDYLNKKGFRIFAIGASTTEEIFVDDQRTWTAQLAQRLESTGGRPVELINTGISGTRIRHNLVTLRRALRLQPDAFLLLIGVNDWMRQIEMSFGGKDPDSLGFGEQIAFANSFLGQLLAGALHPGALAEARAAPPAAWTESGGFYESHRGSLKRGDVRSFRPERVSQDYDRWVHEVGALCAGAGVPCIFITQPSAYQAGARQAIRDRMWMTPPFAGYTLDFDSMVYLAQLYNRYLLATARELGQPACDLAAAIPPTLDYFFDEVHFNEGGDRAVAAALGPCVSAALGWRIHP